MDDTTLDYLKIELMREHNKSHARRIAQFIAADQEKFDVLFTLFMTSKVRLKQRAAWVVNHCVESHPTLLHSHYKDVLNILEQTDDDAAKRNIMRMLQFVNIPPRWQGHFYNQALSFMQSAKEPVAVRCFSMQVAVHIARGIPELELELAELFQDMLQLDSAGIKARARNLLKSLPR